MYGSAYHLLSRPPGPTEVSGQSPSGFWDNRWRAAQARGATLPYLCSIVSAMYGGTSIRRIGSRYQGRLDEYQRAVVQASELYWPKQTVYFIARREGSRREVRVFEEGPFDVTLATPLFVARA